MNKVELEARIAELEIELMLAKLSTDLHEYEHVNREIARYRDILQEYRELDTRN